MLTHYYRDSGILDMHRHFVRSALFATAWLLSGCTTLGLSSDSVKVTVSNIEVIEATLMEQLYRVTLRIQNRSNRRLSITGGRFDLELNGRDFGSGVTNQAATIEPFSDAQVDVRMVSTVFGIVRLVQGFQDRGDRPLDYEISGYLSTDGMIGVPFRDSGEIALPTESRQGDAP